MNIYSVSLKNLKRKPARTWLLFGLIAVASCTLFTATLFFKCTDDALRSAASRFSADIVVVPKDAGAPANALFLAGEPAYFLMEKSVLDRVRAVQDVKHATPQLFIKPEASPCCSSKDVIIVAFDPETDRTVTPWLERNLKRKLGGGEVVLGKKAPGRAGDRISFFGTSFVVAGVMDAAGMDFLDKAVFMTLDAAYAMAEQSLKKAVKPAAIGRDNISAVLVYMGNDNEIARSNAIMRIAREINGATPMVFDALRPMKKQLGGLVRAVLFVGFALWLIVLLILGFAFSLSVHERQRETGLLRAMGANRGHVASLFLAEAAALTGGGGAAGIAFGYGLLLTLKGPLLHQLKLPFLLPSAGALAGLTAEALAFSVLSGLVAALFPLIGTIRMSPYVMIATGE